jgi:hypothetical protein
MRQSIVYRSVFVYRLIMNILYVGGYKKRFKNVIKLINKDDQKIVELCFGDVYIAEWCRRNRKNWLGFDVNQYFVQQAVSKGYDAKIKNLCVDQILPKSDVVVMMGSLYHFHDNITEILDSILLSTKRLIISEPINNLSRKTGIIGFIAKRATNAGQGHEMFRYNNHSLVQALSNACSDKFKFNIISIGYKDAIVEVKWKSV